MSFRELLNIRQRLFAFILALIIPLSVNSCRKEKKDDKKMTDEELSKYISFITSVNAVYNYEEFYITYEQVEKIIANSEKNYDCDYNFNGSIEELISKIKQNSVNFIKENPEYSEAFITDNSDLDNQKLFESIFNNILEELINKATNNVNEDLCLLSDLSVVFSYDTSNSSFNYGDYDPQKNILRIFPKNIEIGSNLEGVDYKILFEETLRHELNHVRQCCCNCRKNKGQLNNDIEIATLIESSAESQIYNQNTNAYSDYRYTYEKERKCESLILLLGLFHDDITIDDYYNAIFNSDLEAFYDFCGMKTAEEIHKLYKIFYSIDAHNLRHEFIFNFIDFEENLTYKDIKNIIGHDYRVDIFSKVLKNMMVYTFEHEDFKLEDNLVMLNMIRSLIVSEACDYEVDSNQNIKRIYESDFSKNIYFLENKYIEFLSSYYNKNVEEIRLIQDEVYYIASNIVLNNAFEIETGNNEIFDRFPLLKPILEANYINISEYDNFVEDSGLSLEKHK